MNTTKPAMMGLESSAAFTTETSRRKRQGSIWFVLLGTLTLVTFGCSSDPASGTGTSNSGATPGGGSSETPATNCDSRCADKASTCGASGAESDSTCSSLCAMKPTSAQLDCIMDKSCEELRSNDTPCGIGANGGGNNGGGNSGGGSNNNGGSNASKKGNGEKCECPNTGDWTSCSGTTGPCKDDLVCFGFDEDTYCGERCKVQEDCKAGYRCTDMGINGVTMGHYCKKG